MAYLQSKNAKRYSKAIIGLGNPDIQYQNTKHNAGFIFVDYLVSQLGLSWETNKTLKALIALDTVRGVVFAKPQTGMNVSGSSVKKILDYFSIETANLIIIHDDVDLKVNQIRFKKEMGSGGHHGVEDIIEKLKSKEFWRYKIGVGRPEHNKFDVKDFVLAKLDAEILTSIEKNAESFLSSNLN